MNIPQIVWQDCNTEEKNISKKKMKNKKIIRPFQPRSAAQPEGLDPLHGRSASGL